MDMEEILIGVFLFLIMAGIPAMIVLAILTATGVLS